MGSEMCIRDSLRGTILPYWQPFLALLSLTKAKRKTAIGVGDFLQILLLSALILCQQGEFFHPIGGLDPIHQQPSLLGGTFVEVDAHVDL